MAPKKTKRKHAESEGVHTHIHVQVTSFDTTVSAEVNHDVYAPEHAWLADENDPLYTFRTSLEIEGTILDPKDRAGHSCRITIASEDRPSSRIFASMQSVQEQDEYRCPRYRTYRGREIPIYKPPKGLALFDKVWGEPRWTAWLTAKPSFVSDTLTLLRIGRPLYIEVHEHKIDRQRWIRGLRMQTELPEMELDEPPRAI